MSHTTLSWIHPRHALGVLAVAGTLALPGCASAPADSGFADVRSRVARATGDPAVWNEGPSPASLAEARALLTEGVTADRAVAVALLNNHALQATLGELGIARADLVEAGLLRNPLLGGEVRFPGGPVAPYELSLIQSVMDLLARPGRRRRAASEFEQVKLRVTAAILDAGAQTREAFYTVEASQEMAALRATLRDAAQASAELSKRQKEAGNATALELDREEGLFDQARWDLTRAEAQARLDRETLDRLMGTPGLAWTIASAVPPPPPSDPTLEGLEEVAVENRLEIAEARAVVDWSAKAKPLARLEKLGELSIGAHQERDGEGEKSTGPAIEVSVPVFNRGQAAAMRAMAVLRRARERLAALEVQVRSEVRVAHARLSVSRSAVEYFEGVALPRRQRMVAEVQLEYNAMQTGVFHLLQAKEEELSAQVEGTLARRDYWLARTELERAVGGRRILDATAESHGGGAQ